MRKHFSIAVLGCSGGPRESNLSSYLVASYLRPQEIVALDAGTLLSGMAKVVKKKRFRFEQQGLSLECSLLHHIRAYLISHPHLDHLAGLIHTSQIDLPPKTIYGFPFTIDAIASHLFNGIIWPNYGSEGQEPTGLYQYERVEEGKRIAIQGTSMVIESFPLSHGERLSTAFLMELKGKYLLYFGDVAADRVTGKMYNRNIWERIAPLIREKKLRGLFLECSYAKEGSTCHLTPALFMEEMNQLKNISQSDLSSFPIIVTHRKEECDEKNEGPLRVKEQLERANQLGLHLIFPRQGDVFTL